MGAKSTTDNDAMSHCGYRSLNSPVPALAVWFDVPLTANGAKLSEFLVKLFLGWPLWIIADPDRDAFLNDDIEIVAEAQRDSETISIGWTPCATTAYLSAFARQMGFSWDGWLLLSGERGRETLEAAAQAWFNSRTNLQNLVSAEACYPYGDGTGLVWVPKVSLSEAQQYVSQGP